MNQDAEVTRVMRCIMPAVKQYRHVPAPDLDFAHRELQKTVAEALAAPADASAQKPDGEVAVTDQQIIDACAEIYLSDFQGPQGTRAYDVAIVRAVLSKLAVSADAPVAEPVFYVHPDDVKSESEFMSELGAIPFCTKPTSYFSHPLYARPPAPEDAKGAARKPMTRMQSPPTSEFPSVISAKRAARGELNYYDSMMSKEKKDAGE